MQQWPDGIDIQTQTDDTPEHVILDLHLREDDVVTADLPNTLSTSAGGPQRKKKPDPPSEGPYSQQEVAERDWNIQARQQAKAEGHTLPGTTKFPIENATDLDHAIGLNGHGDKAKNRKWIKRAAARLGLSSRIPDSWS